MTFRTKQDLKLDSFLKKNLGQGELDRVRAYDECIVNSERESKAFKYVILTDEYLYLTENPPKTIKEEDAVHLKDVVSIKLVNDYPDFLSGEERENTQHIQITYNLPLKPKGKNRDRKTKKETVQVPPLVRQYSDPTAGPPVGEVVEASPSLSNHHLTLKTAPSGRPGSGQSSPRRGSVEKLYKSLDETELTYLRGQQNREPGSDDESTSSSSDRMSLSLPAGHFKNISPSSSLTADEIREQLRGRRGSNKTKEVNGPLRPLPPRPEDSEDADSKSGLDHLSKTFTGSLALNLANKSQSSKVAVGGSASYRSLPSVDARRSSPQLPDLSPGGGGGAKNSGSDRNEKKNFLSMLFQRKGSKDGDDEAAAGAEEGRAGSEEQAEVWDLRMTSDQLLYGSDQTRTTLLHVYILNLVSPFMMCLQCAWSNYTIYSTLILDEEYAEQLGCSKTSKNQSREQLEILFHQMKQEILSSGNSIENLGQLAHELNISAQKYFVLKRLFWKNKDLFEFIICELQKYLPKSYQHNSTERADELELAVLLVDTIGVMFRETEIVSSRLTTLGSHSGKMALDLLVLLTCYPEVPQRWRPRTAPLMLESDSDGWNTYEDAEVSKLVQELTNMSTGVLFELILIAHQANWGQSKGKFFNICWVIKFLENLSSTENFLERMLAQTIKLLSPSKNEILTPAEAILLFKQFSILQTFVEYSPNLALHIRNTYTEEFRYYVQSLHIMKKLPSHYPIAKLTLRLISEVLSYVLQKPMKL